MKREELAKSIDHTLLRPDTTVEEIEKLCIEAQKYGFASVCVPPWFTNIAYRFLKGSSVKTCTVVGFPFGYSTTGAKVHETHESIDLGAAEIDAVMNVSALKSSLHDEVYRDIRGIVETARRAEVEVGHDVIVKIIIQADLLNDEQKIRAVQIIDQAGADFVKTNTGFTHGIATIEDIELLRANVPFEMGIKASGGIRSAEQAIAMLNAGATRIGTSSGVKIIEELL